MANGDIVIRKLEGPIPRWEAKIQIDQTAKFEDSVLEQFDWDKTGESPNEALGALIVEYAWFFRINIIRL